MAGFTVGSYDGQGPDSSQSSRQEECGLNAHPGKEAAVDTSVQDDESTCTQIVTGDRGNNSEQDGNLEGKEVEEKHKCGLVGAYSKSYPLPRQRNFTKHPKVLFPSNLDDYHRQEKLQACHTSTEWQNSQVNSEHNPERGQDRVDAAQSLDNGQFAPLPWLTDGRWVVYGQYGASVQDYYTENHFRPNEAIMIYRTDELGSSNGSTPEAMYNPATHLDKELPDNDATDCQETLSSENSKIKQTSNQPNHDPFQATGDVEPRCVISYPELSPSGDATTSSQASGSANHRVPSQASPSYNNQLPRFQVDPGLLADVRSPIETIPRDYWKVPVCVTLAIVEEMDELLRSNDSGTRQRTELAQSPPPQSRVRTSPIATRQRIFNSPLPFEPERLHSRVGFHPVAPNLTSIGEAFNIPTMQHRYMLVRAFADNDPKRIEVIRVFLPATLKQIKEQVIVHFAWSPRARNMTLSGDGVELRISWNPDTFTVLNEQNVGDVMELLSQAEKDAFLAVNFLGG
ncbi:hypothetical protein M501DRAFT_534803 [Patellaria atrata CBS 101060]|uniref:Uncharacterized protein n=1 Tax=Patellaria atrata CBS 101060 TaxID=1346257 RepID=A0A9P4VTU0_9PEZI|nr:hypothetical protein M501DRAFT_534803 [Patellaria atrata CBS 101060]